MRISESLRSKETLVITFAGILLYANYLYVAGIVVKIEEILLSLVFKAYGLFIVAKILTYLVLFTMLLIFTLRLIRNAVPADSAVPEGEPVIVKERGNINALMVVLVSLLPLFYGLSIFLNYLNVTIATRVYVPNIAGQILSINNGIDIVFNILNFLYFIIVAAMLLTKKN
jgi:hypothetical protein